MSELPLITIGITCYNAENSIERAIKSALSQDWENTEIIIVDDGSSDDSLRVITPYVQKYEHVHLIEHELNSGFPAALNTIFGNAKGEFVALFDDDDISWPDRLSQQYQRIKNYEDAHETHNIFCYTGREVFSSIYDAEISHTLTAIGHSAPEPNGSMVADYLLWDTGRAGYQWGMFGSCTLMVHTNLVRDIGGFDTNFRRCAEWDLAVRAAISKDVHFIAVDQPLVQQYKTATPDKANTIPLLYALNLRHKHKDYLKTKGIGFYQAAIFLAKARFYGSKNHITLSKFYRALNALLICGRS